MAKTKTVHMKGPAGDAVVNESDVKLYEDQGYKKYTAAEIKKREAEEAETQRKIEEAKAEAAAKKQAEEEAAAKAEAEGGEGGGEGDEDPPDYDSMTVPQLKALAEERELEVASNITKDALIDLLEEDDELDEDDN